MTADLWSDVSTVEREAGSIPLGSLGFATQADEDTYVEALLEAAQDAINQFLHRAYTSSTAPAAVVHSAIVVAATGLRKIAINKKGGVIQTGQLSIQLQDATIFTPELKAEIADFMAPRTIQTKSTTYQTDEISDNRGP